MAKIRREMAFDSLTEVLDINATCEKKFIKASKTGDYDFTGTHSYEEALEIATHGYELDSIETKMENIQEHISLRDEMINDVAGFMPDIPAYLAGDPENMFAWDVVEEEHTKYVHIVYATSEAARVTKEQLLNRATAISSIIYNLEIQGYRVKLTAANVNHFNNGMNGTFINIKDYEHSIDIGEIAGTLHPSFLRRVMFRYYEASHLESKNGTHKKWFDGDMGYGSNLNYEKYVELLKNSETLRGEDYVFLPSIFSMNHSDKASSKFKTEDDAAKYVEILVNEIDHNIGTGKLRTDED